MMKKVILIALFTFHYSLSTTVYAQGGNTRMGGNDGPYQSLAERIAKIEKKNDAFNVYFNYAAAAHTQEQGNGWETGFANKELRLEIKGSLTDKIFYRLRHRLNKDNSAKGEDNFAKATDIMMVGYNFSDKFSVMGGKMTQIWGGYEYDENPMYIYKYSDFVDHMDIYMAGVAVSYKPLPTQEIAFEVSNASNGKLEEDDGPVVLVQNPSDTKRLEQAKSPLAFIANWNSSFLDDKLQTRWSWGIQKQAADKVYSRMLILGQRLNLPKVQWYFDYMGAFEDMDRLGIATQDAGLPGRLGSVRYNTFITKLNWQFAHQWNLMLKGTYETVNVKNYEKFRDYRKSYGWVGSIEYYPDPTQDLRIFLAYIGKKIDYSKACGLDNTSSNRFELGFMYRIKCY